MAYTNMEVKNRRPISAALALFMFGIIRVRAEDTSHSKVLGALGHATASASAGGATRKDPIPETAMPSHLRRGKGVSLMGPSLTSLSGPGGKRGGSDVLRRRNLHDIGQVRGIWPFDEGAGQLVFDKTKNDNRGFLGAALGPEGQDPTWNESGGRKFLTFDGTDDVVTIPNDPSLEPRTVGVQAVVRGPPQGNFKYILTKGVRGTCAGSYGLYSGPFSGISFYVDPAQCAFINTQETAGVTDAASIWNNDWNQVVGIFDGSCVAIYVNGVFGDAQVAGGIDYSRPDSEDLFIGNYGDGTQANLPLDGDIDEIQIGTSEPLAVPKGPQVVRVGTKVQFDASHSFLAMSYRWDFGYGKTSTQLKPTHVFQRPGIYEVCLKINAGIGVPDVCENLVLEDKHCMKVVVYDPNERREVSGEGKIHSPIGAYKKAKALDGYASFMFNAPLGPAEFNFRRAGLSLTSKSYKWYVITRTQAVLQGTGYLRDGYGKKSAKFMIFVTTAPKKTFRIRIEDLSGKMNVVYDSGAQTLSHGGNIQINSYY